MKPVIYFKNFTPQEWESICDKLKSYPKLNEAPAKFVVQRTSGELRLTTPLSTMPVCFRRIIIANRQNCLQIALDKNKNLHFSYFYFFMNFKRYFPDGAIMSVEFLGLNSVVYQVSKDYLFAVMSFFRYHFRLRYTFLLDIWVVDLPARQNRFEINYCLASAKHPTRVYFKVFTDE